MNPRRFPPVAALVLLAGLAWAPAARSGPGSGSAGIAPSTPVVAGTAGKWSITYTAAEVIDAGSISITIPAGWTPPQTSSSTSPGFITVSTSQVGGTPSLSLGGSVVTIDIDTLSIGNTVTLTYGDDAGGANPGARAVAATTKNSYPFVVASDPAGSAPVPIGASPSITVNAAAPAVLAWAPGDTTVTAGEFAPYRINVLDAFGNRSPVPANRTVNVFAGHGLFYLPANHTTNVAQVTILSGQSSVRVDYRGTLVSGGTPHSLTAITASGSPTLAGFDQVNVTVGPLSLSVSSISANSPVLANGVAQSNAAVTSRDAFGNPRAGDTVVISVTGSAVKVDPVPPTTNASGVASGVVTNTKAETVSVSASINDQPLTSPAASVTFTAGPVSGATSIVDATTPVTANGSSVSTVTVTARDANNNPIAGQNVTLSVSPSANAILNQPGGVTNSLGQVTGTLTSTVPGLRTVKANVEGTAVVDSAVVSFTAGAIASFEWTVDGAATAGLGEEVTLTARDAQGNIATGYTGTVNLSTSSGSVGDGVVEWSTSDAFGNLVNGSDDAATYQFVAGDNGDVALRIKDELAETITLSAVDGGASDVSGAIVVSHAAADIVVLETGDGQSAPVDTNVPIAPRVRVTDAYDNPVAGHPVTFRLLSGGGSVDAISGGGVDSTRTTAADGRVTCDEWRLGTATGPNQLRALIASGSTPSVDFTATGTAGTGTSLVLTPASKGVTVGAFEVVTATLKDAFNNPVPGARVDLAITSVNGGTLASDPGHTTTQLSPTARWGSTDAAGQTTVRFVAPGTAGLANTVDASTSAIAQGAVTDAVYTTIASGATNLRITFVGPSTVQANQSFQFTVEAIDGNQNVDTGNSALVTLAPEAGSGIVFSLTDFGATVTQVTLSSGTKTVYGRSTVANPSWDITASGGGLGSDTQPVTITDTGVIDHYSVSTVASVVAGVAFNVNLQARDVYNNVVAGANNTVNLTAVDDANSSLPAQSTLLVGQASLVSGSAIVSETYTFAEPIRVKASAGGKEGVSGIVTVSAAAAKRIAKISGDNTGVAAGGPQLLVARVYDNFDNPVPGEPVTFQIVSGGGSISGTPVVTNAAGDASNTLTTGVVAGTNQVKAIIGDENPPALERVDYTVQTVAGGIAYFTVVPLKSALLAGESTQLTISAYDADDNLVSNDNTTQIQLSSSGSAQFGAATGTLTAGVFATTVLDTVAQSFTVTAEKQGGGPPSGTSGSIVVSNGPAYRVVKISGDASGVTAGGTQPLEVLVRDQYGNPVAGAVTTFQVATAPDGTAFIQDAVGDPDDGITVSDAAGHAFATLHTATAAGANTVNAQINDGTPPALERVTFTVNTNASAANALRITFLGSTTLPAGQSFAFKVDALDAGLNIDTGNNSQVTLTPEVGSTLQFSLTDFGATVTQFNLVGGTRTLYGRATKTGNWDITASSGALVPDIGAVTITDTGLIAGYAVTAPDSVIAGALFDVNIEARDTYGNKVIGAGNGVNLVAVDDLDSTVVAAGTLSQGQATLVAGAVVRSESYTVAERIRVRVRDAGSKQGFSGIVKIKPAAAYSVANVTGSPTGVVAGAGQVLTARVLDSYGNRVAGQLVSFSVLQGGGNVSPGSQASSAVGEAATTLTTGTVAGSNIVRAQILDGNPPGLERADFTVTTIAGPIANYLVTPVKTSLAANEMTNVTVRARDTNNNTVTQDNTTLVTLSHTGSATLGVLSGTLTAGQFTTTVRDTVAETFTVSAQSGTPTGTSPTITVSSGPAYRIVEVSGDASGFPVDAEQALRSEVRDQWGNPVAGANVAYLIVSSPPPPTAYLRDAAGDSTDGIATTLANGRALARLKTSQTAGLNTVSATILDGSPAAREKVTFDVTTVAGGIAYYTVVMGAATAVAGAPVNVTVSAYDTNDNLVDDDATQVVLSGNPGTGLVFGANPVTLTNGVATTTVIDTVQETYQVRANTVGVPGVSGQGAAVVVSAAPPAGVITATATQNTITANGTATTTITSGVIRDPYGNQVAAGLQVNVSAGNGGVILGGTARAIDAAGKIVFDLKASTTPGPSLVTMTSATGTASGTINITFAPPPAFACDEVPVPSIVVPGDDIAFSVNVQNTSTTSATLSTATTFNFSDGVHSYSATLAAPTVAGPGATVALAFNLATLDAAFTPALYQPNLSLAGTDAFGSPFSLACSLPAQSVLVTSIEITSITAPPIVSRGQQTTVAVNVRNNGAQATTISDLTLSFIPGTGLFSQDPAPELGLVLVGGATGTFNVPVTVGAASPLGLYQIDAFAEGMVNGKTVVDNSLAPTPLPSWTVVAEANLAYVAGTLAPPVASRGQLYSYQMSIKNDGDGVVSLDTSMTRLTFTDGALTYSAAPIQPYAIAGGATQLVTFKPKSVPAGFLIGTYDVILDAHGTENGATFDQQVTTTGSGDGATIVTPAGIALALGNPLLPDQVTRQATTVFTVQVNNTGGATVILTPATTTLSFTGFSAALDPTGPTTVPPGLTTLKFLGAAVTSAAGNYTPQLQLTGTENGLAYAKPLATENVLVQDAAVIAINAILPSQPKFTADQTRGIKVRMVVANNGGAAVNFTTASLRFFDAATNRTGQFAISAPAGFVGGATLSGGEIDTLVFNVADNGGNAMSAGNLTIEGQLQVLDPNTSQTIVANTDGGGKGALQVQTPATITILSVTPSQSKVTQSMVKPMTIAVSIRNNGQSDVNLTLPAGATLAFTPALAGWLRAPRAALEGGGTVLSGGETDVLVFDVSQAGSITGSTIIDAAINGVETNSGRALLNSSSGLGNVLVQSPGNVTVQSVVASRTTMTSGAAVPWTLTVSVSNTGGSDVDLAMGGAIIPDFDDATVLPLATLPTALAGGGTLLSGGETDQFVVSMPTAGTYPASGSKTMGVAFGGTEVNSGAGRAGDGSATVQIQKAPVIAYDSLTPPVVSKGASVGFNVTVSNTDVNAATVTLNPATTRLQFAGFDAGLSGGSVLIAGGEQKILTFTPTLIPTGIPEGAINDAQLVFNWTENGRAGSQIVDITPGDIVVQNAPDLSIVSIRASKPTMTRQQSDAGTITMVLRNQGSAAVDLNLAPASTRLQLNLLGGGTNVTSEYTLLPPAALVTAGTAVLAGGATDSLVFAVSQAGISTGTVIVSGFVAGTDENSGLPVSANTANGGTGNFALQLPGALAIRSIAPAQTTATVGQTKTYKIRMAVENTGGADVDLVLVDPTTTLSFPNSTGWVYSLSPALAGGGVKLSGGEIDTVTFTVTTTGSPAGLASIGGEVAGSENNTGLVRSATDSGSGGITLQAPAVLVVDSVTPSRTTVTAGTSVDWDVEVAVRNAGQAAARITLPSNFGIAIQNSTGGTVFAPAVALQGGGNTLAAGASGTLLLHTNGTGTFSSPGAKTINLTVAGVETNSNGALSAPGVGSVTVQSAPDLQITAGPFPNPVTQGASAGFSVDVSNPVGAATVKLDRGLTRVYFAGSYSAFLNPGVVDTIAGGQTATLTFENKPVGAIATGPYDFNIDLAYTANAVTSQVTRTVTNGVTVQAAPQLAILGIDTSRPTVTAGQSVPWTATMRVTNNGSSPIDIDFASNKTRLTFIKPGGTTDGTFVVDRPTAFMDGDTLLAANGGTNQIEFSITQTGTTPGVIAINGRVEGTDLNQALTVFDDTFDGGRGTIIVQTASSVVINATHTSQPRVTVGQMAAWAVRVPVSNGGSAEVTLDLAGSGLTFNGSTAGWTVDPPTLIVAGGNVLAGGTVDSLLFNVTGTGSIAGDTRIDASIPWTEINTAQTGTATTTSAGFGSVLVQTPPSVRITTTTIQAPNAPEVNLNQAFSVAVQVQNTGQADARDVQLSLDTDGLSDVPASFPVIALVPGGQTVQQLLPVTAATTANPLETFTSGIDAAIDNNSGASAAKQAALDSLATATVQTPAVLDISGVWPSQPTVTQGQSNPWELIVELSNPGGADVELTPPTKDDLAFSIGGSNEIDYVVTAPATLASGTPVWRLAGGAVDSLVYTIVATGTRPGSVDISLGVAGTDRNQPSRLVGDTGATSVNVQGVAGLAIISTVGVGTVNHASANRDTVNTGFNYQIHVTVQNSGEKVDSVLVALANDDGSTVAITSLIRQSIDADSLHTFVFDVTAPPTPTPLETFSANILPGVVSHNSGQPVTPEPPIDNTHVVVTRTRADLTTTLVISSPPGAVGGTVSTNQTFQMTAVVSNGGQASLLGAAQVTLTPPPGGGFSVNESLVRTFTAGQPVVWNVTAPPAPQSALAFACSLSTTPLDANTGGAAFASVPGAEKLVAVSTGGALAAPDVFVFAPGGATDDTVSVAQNFTVRARVTPSADTDAVVATLTLPAGFSVVGSPIRNLGNGDGAQKQADYVIIAPTTPRGASDIFVTFTGTDANSGDPVPSSADTVAVAVVPRASLTALAAVTAPPDATDNTVGVATPFTITATVENPAPAAGIGSPGMLTIGLPAGKGFALAGGETAAKPFAIGTPVQWVVVAPQLPSGPDQITVFISTVPPDENSGQPAQVVTGTATIAMVTEGSAVAVTDVSSTLELANAVAPGGASGLDLFGFRIAYNVTDTNVPAAEIDSIAITVVGRDGKALSDAVLAQTLKRLSVDLGGAQPYEVIDPAANPVVLALAAGGSDRTIAPNASVTAVVSVDLDPAPRATEFSVGIRSGGLVVRDPGSGQLLGVTDGNGRPLDGQLTSRSLVVLSSNFEEYVHNYPNPFRAGSQATKIAYFLERAAPVSLKIYALTGELVWEEAIAGGDARAQAGPQETQWDGRNSNGDVVRNGVYVCVISAGSKSTKFRIAVAK
ncbi:MAG TPA: Ig-like domain-containing protein [Candidatus Krumholzibacteria bacterium]|nr:Ig-like domain-containing protein [Candidatus Krumholzibacteria bacterium]